MSKLPTIMPMLARLHREPFDGSEWVFEVKHDGFRAIAFIEDGHCRLISRNGYRFGGFRDLEESLGQALKGHTAILDGEIVCLDGQGRSVFTTLIERQAVPYFYAFDLLYLDSQDWRRRPLIERKQTLAQLIGRHNGSLLYVDHLDEQGRALYEAACGLDLEGIVAKRKDSRYVVTQTRNWLKIKNPHYSQAIGRQDLCESWQGCANNETVKQLEARAKENRDSGPIQTRCRRGMDAPRAEHSAAR